MRLKLIAGPVGIAIAAGLIATVAVWMSLHHKYAKHIDARLGPDTELLMRSLVAEGLRIQDSLATRVEAEQVANVVIASAGEVQQRARAFEAANHIASFFAENDASAGKPDIVAIVDERGQVIARDLDPNRMHGSALTQELKALSTVLRLGQVREDLWQFQGKLLRATIVPLHAAGNVVGAVVVGYDLSAGALTEHARLVGHDLALLLNNEIYSTTLTSNARQTFKELCKKALSPEIQRALSQPQMLRWDDKDSSLQGMLKSWPSPSALPVSVAMVIDSAEGSYWTSSVWLILLVTALAVVGLFIYGLAMADNLLRPLEVLEEGVFAVINGRADQRIDIASEEYGGLAYRINQLINLYTGVSESDEEGHAVASTGNWKHQSDPPPALMPSLNMDYPDARIAALCSEPIDQYEARIYREYVQAKQRIGEDVSSINQERFVQRLNANAEHLVKKNSCRMVRFEVQVDGTQVNLVPVNIP